MSSHTANLLVPVAWMLIHSLWQSFAVMIVYRLCARSTATAAARYGIGVGLIAIFLIMQIATGALAFLKPDIIHDVVAEAWTRQQPLTNAGVATLRLPPDATFANAVAAVEPLLPWVAAVWLAGMAAQIAWLSVITYWLKLEVRRCREVVGLLGDRLAEIQARLGGKALVVRFLESDSISVPGTVGWLRPLVLVPTGWLLNTPPRDVEAIVLHELAHIVRRDFVGAMGRAILGRVYYFNLPLRSLLNAVANEAEKAADEIAAKAVGDVKFYGEALLRLELTRPSLALALGAASGSLPDRARYLAQLHLGARHRVLRLLGVTTAAMASIALVSFAILVLAMDRDDVTWLKRHSLTSGVLALTVGDRPNPVAEQILADLHSSEAFTPAKLKSFATALRDGFDGRRFVEEADAVPVGQPFAKAELPTFGNARERAALVTALQRLAEASEGQARADAARAALVLSAINLSDMTGAPATRLIREPSFQEALSLSAAKNRRMERLATVHIRRVRSVFDRVGAPGSSQLDPESLAQLLVALDYLPGAWRQLIRIPNRQIREQLIAALRRDEL